MIINDDVLRPGVAYALEYLKDELGLDLFDTDLASDLNIKPACGEEA